MIDKSANTSDQNWLAGLADLLLLEKLIVLKTGTTVAGQTRSSLGVSTFRWIDAPDKVLHIKFCLIINIVDSRFE